MEISSCRIHYSMVIIGRRPLKGYGHKGEGMEDFKARVMGGGDVRQSASRKLRYHFEALIEIQPSRPHLPIEGKYNTSGTTKKRTFLKNPPPVVSYSANIFFLS